MKRVVVDPATDCWNFMGARSTGGYGLIGVATGRCASAHRVSYELFVGPIPTDKELHHTCANRPCVNPTHLRPVLRAVHVRVEPRSMANRTHCKRGHPLTRENVSAYTLRTRNARQCLLCKRIAEKARYGARRAQRHRHAHTSQ